MADITNPLGAFGYTDLQTKHNALVWEFKAQSSITGPACVVLNTTGNVATAATNASTVGVFGICINSPSTNQIARVVVFGIAENVPTNGAVSALDRLKPSATTAGYVAATATPATGEAIGWAISASASNVTDVWVSRSIATS
jgi:hypothetical protein